MEDDQCVYARSLLGRLNDLIEGSGNISSFEDIQTGNLSASNKYSNLGQGFKINPGFAILLVAMIIIGLMSLKRNNKQNQSKL